MIAARESDAPLLRLLLGESAFDLAQKRLDTLRVNFEAWLDGSEGTDFSAI